MKILVINGSPKSKYSTTLHTVLYLEKKFKEHEFEYLHAGAGIRKLEKDFSEAKEKMEKADLILFSYPVYTFIAPSQLHRFIELMKENQVNLKGKFVSQITTSKHFYDITAHKYLEENVQDLGMKYIKGLSADMDDLLKAEGRKDAEEFFRYVNFCVERDIYEVIPTRKEITDPVKVSPISESLNSADASADLTSKKEIVIVADLKKDDAQLASMIERFMKVSKCKVKLVNIEEFPFKGGCLGCFNCAVDGGCIYTDGFDKFLREEIQTADAIVIAFTIKDHSMGARFKMYDDRQFCNGHRTVTMGMPFGYLISGSYHEERNLMTIVEGRAEVGGNFLAGVATDEQNPDLEIDQLAEKLAYAMENSYVQPANFYGVGGMKIFRDLIWLMQGMMKADHKFYKSHGQYDFPQKHKGTMMKMYLVGALISNKKIKAKMGNKMSEGMIGPYKKVINEIDD